MGTSDRFRFGPTRGELWFWLVISGCGLGLTAAAVWLRGVPDGPAIAEVVALAGVAFGFLGGRSIKRLIRRQHP